MAGGAAMTAKLYDSAVTRLVEEGRKVIASARAHWEETSDIDKSGRLDGHTLVIRHCGMPIRWSCEDCGCNSDRKCEACQ